MKIIKTEVKINEETLAPELHVTMVFPMELSTPADPSIPYAPTWPPQQPAPMPSPVCSVCDLDLYRSMGFVCGNELCPTYPRATSVNFGTKTDEGYNR